MEQDVLPRERTPAELLAHQPGEMQWHVLKQLNVFFSGARVLEIDAEEKLLKNLHPTGHVLKIFRTSDITALIPKPSPNFGVRIELTFAAPQKPYRLLFRDYESCRSFVVALHPLVPPTAQFPKGILSSSSSSATTAMDEGTGLRDSVASSSSVCLSSSSTSQHQQQHHSSSQPVVILRSSSETNIPPPSSSTSTSGGPRSLSPRPSSTSPRTTSTSLIPISPKTTPLSSSSLNLHQLSLSGECRIQEICRRFLASLEVPLPYFDARFDRCYCEVCSASRGELEGNAFARGKPARTYVLPHGWCRFGLSVSQAIADAEHVFSRWNICFHGTTPTVVKSIIRQQTLLLPGDRLPDGSELGIREDVKRIPNQRYTFTSPTIRYAGCSAYATLASWEGMAFRVAVQLRQEPGTFEIQPETIGWRRQRGSDVRIDPFFENEHVEWKSNTRGTTMPYGVLIILIEHCSHCDGRAHVCKCTKGCPKSVRAECHARHCAHCMGRASACACAEGCKRPESGSKCFDHIHCVHCRGKGKCTCSHSCKRPDLAHCSSNPKTKDKSLTMHCSHCSGEKSKCQCKHGCPKSATSTAKCDVPIAAPPPPPSVLPAIVTASATVTAPSPATAIASSSASTTATAAAASGVVVSSSAVASSNTAPPASSTTPAGVVTHHCAHCKGKAGVCACQHGCGRDGANVQCYVLAHCRHCKGGAGACACRHGCGRQAEAKCWDNKHCSHCKGHAGPCACKVCPRPATSECIPPS